MRIERATLHHLRIPLRRPFEHALHRRSEAEMVIVCVESSDGETGYGEVAPRSYLTGESVASVLENAPAMLRTWMKSEIESPEQLVLRVGTERELAGRKLATFAGIELALLDVAGNHFGFPVADLLGETEHGLPPRGVVIGFEVETSALARHCGILRTLGHGHVKVKVGRDDDLVRVGIASAEFGPDVSLRLDANGAWSAPHAIDLLRSMHELPIDSIEQPCAADDLEGLRSVRAGTSIPVMADESLASLDDARRLIAAEAVDLFNLRVGKCGGLLGSLRILELARTAGLDCHLGTLVGETGILSTAGEIFSRRAGKFPCLEGRGQSHFLLQKDVLASDTSEGDPGPTGLGIRVDEARLSELAASNPIHIHRHKGIAN